MNKLIDDLKNVKPGDIFITQTQQRMRYMYNLGVDYTFKHRLKLLDVSEEVFVTYDQRGIPHPAFHMYREFWLSYKAAGS